MSKKYTKYIILFSTIVIIFSLILLYSLNKYSNKILPNESKESSSNSVISNFFSSQNIDSYSDNTTSCDEKIESISLFLESVYGKPKGNIKIVLLQEKFPIFLKNNNKIIYFDNTNSPFFFTLQNDENLFLDMLCNNNSLADRGEYIDNLESDIYKIQIKTNKKDYNYIFNIDTQDIEIQKLYSKINSYIKNSRKEVLFTKNIKLLVENIYTDIQAGNSALDLKNLNKSEIKDEDFKIQKLIFENNNYLKGIDNRTYYVNYIPIL